MVDLVLLGAPGAGKGTQAELLGAALQVPRISSGDLFRSAIAGNTDLGRRVRDYMECGELVPDQVTIDMVAERVSREDCARGVVFDGFPRTTAQAQALAALLAQMGRQVDAVLYIRVAEKVLLERLAGRWTCGQCGQVYHKLHSPEGSEGSCDACGGALSQRADDKPETQVRRIEVYLQQTTPLEDYYRESGRLHEVDGNRDIASVQGDIRAVLRKLFGSELLPPLACEQESEAGE